MRPPKKNNYLISAEKDGKVTGLYWSEDLVELSAIKTIHKDSNVYSMDMTNYKMIEAVPLTKNEIVKKKFTKNGKPFANKVKCIETGVIYDSVPEASRQLGIPRINIYMAVRRNIAAYGLHFELLPPPSKE